MTSVLRSSLINRSCYDCKNDKEEKRKREKERKHEVASQKCVFLRSRVTFFTRATSRASSSIFSRIGHATKEVFAPLGVRVSVSRTTRCRCATIPSPFDKTRISFAISEYLVSTSECTRGVGEEKRKRKGERMESQENALECKPDPCEIRGPAAVPPTTTDDG